MAPELFLMETPLMTIESQKVDIWALGVVAFEMFFGRKPFESQSLEKLSKKYQEKEYYLNLEEQNKNISKEFIEFLNLCLQEKSEKRADVFDLQRTDFYNIEYERIELLNEKELYASLGSPERDEKNNILLRIDHIYYNQNEY